MLAETRQIDLITTLGRSNIYRLLLVVEAGEWHRPGAKWLLLEKLGTYARYALGGQMQREDPASAGAPVQLVLLSDDPLPPLIRSFVTQLAQLLLVEGLTLLLQSPDDHGIDGPLEDLEVSPAPPGEGTNPGLRPRPEYPQAEAFVPALRYHRWRSSLSRAVRRVVVHISDGQDDYQKVLRYFQNPMRGGRPAQESVHYVIGRRGEVVQLVRHDDIAWHARAANADSVGVLVIARGTGIGAPTDLGLPVVGAQYQAVAQLVQWLSGTYKLLPDRQHVLGHDEVEADAAHRGCPGRLWSWDRFMAALSSGRPPSR